VLTPRVKRVDLKFRGQLPTFACISHDCYSVAVFSNYTTYIFLKINKYVYILFLRKLYMHILNELGNTNL